ncbi:MAG TPA: xanthine dehydrogenase family protein molybdopterin-binding subunit [Sediminispirochaeta sp.]|nr:xanthine dehydrogenase family protein molybdopterin-binding subunit [Sediminispirochaeta sp.]
MDKVDDNFPFVDKYKTDGMFHVQIVRAEIPRGRIESWDTSKLPEEVLFFSAEDLPGKNELSLLSETMPLLAAKEVNYQGEPLFLLASKSSESLEEAKKKIRIDYETDFSLLAFEPSSSDQVIDRVSLVRGSEERNYGSGTQIIEAQYRTSSETHIGRAPLGAFTYWENERLVVHTPSHWPYHVRGSVADVLKISPSKVKVIQSNPSPAYGEKVFYPSLVSAMAALVTLKTGSPARLLLSPEEVERFTTKKAPVEVNRTSVIDENGTILAEDVHLRFNVGAYPMFTRELLIRAAISSGNFYHIPNINITVEAIRTSAPPMNLYRGLGVAQSLFATEVHSSRLAEFSQLNPGDWKIEHASKRRIITGSEIKKMPLPELLKQVLEKSDFYRKHSAYELTRKRRSSIKTSRSTLRGIGVSSGFTGNGFTEKPTGDFNWGISAVLDSKDRLSIECGTLNIPRAIQDIWKRKAAEILGISTDSVEIIDGDTDSLPDSGPMMLGMPVSVYTSLVERCCTYIRKQRFHKPLPIRVHRNIPAARKNVWNRESLEGLPYQSLSWGAVVTEVELDPLTLMPEVRGVWASFDCGLIYDTSYAVSIAEAGIYEALAWSMGEERGSPRYYQDYSLENPETLYLRLPPVSVHFLNQSRGVPGGINEIAESLVPASFITAMSQAAGVYFDRIPLTPELIHGYLEEQT